MGDAPDNNAGCSHGLAGTSNALLRVDTAYHRVSQVAELSHFLVTHPVAHPHPADFEPDGTWFAMASAGDDLYATEPNHQEMDRIGEEGKVSRVVDFSTGFTGATDWRGPTTIMSHNGAWRSTGPPAARCARRDHRLAAVVVVDMERELVEAGGSRRNLQRQAREFDA